MLEAWSRGTEGGYVSRLALGNHFRKHMALTPAKGRRPMTGDLAKDIIGRVSERMESGEIEPRISDGLKAVALVDRREAADLDRNIWAKVTLAISGAMPPRQLPDPDVSILEAEYRVYAEGGDRVDAERARDEASRRLLPATISEAD
jgi:hypothetical protein